MFRLLILGSAALALLAQDNADLFGKPPADVDAALRARITEFFQYHVKQQFRQAEALVADDTKEFFYSHNKPQYLSFEIVRIQYSDNFTKATATMLAEQYVMIPGFTEKPIKTPIPSTWKLIDGKWYWYVDQESLRNSPFGKMTAGEGRPGTLHEIPASPDFVMGKVKPDKASVALHPGEEAQIKLTNTAPGYMSVAVEGKPLGIEAGLDRTDIPRDAAAVLTVKALEGAKSGRVNVRVSPTGEIIPITVSVH